MTNRTVSVALKMLIGDYVSQADKASKSTEGIGDSATRSAAKYKMGAQQIVAGAGVAAVAGALALHKVVSASMDFDKAMSGVGAVSNATAGEMDLLREAALNAGRDTAFSASQAAEAEAELAKAGVSTADILGGALKGSLDLAAAGQLELGEAAEISAQAMNIWKLKGSDVGHIADTLAAGANKSAADVKGLGDAMRQSGLVAAQMGIGMEDTVGILSAFADRALQGSDAGTSLKTMLQRLSAPSKEAAAQMRQLGINAYDSSGQFVGLKDFAGQLQASLGSLSEEQRNAALTTIFGSDAVRAATVLYEVGASGVQEYSSAVRDQGAAGRMAGKQMDNLAGDIETLRGSIETALIKSGSAATGILRSMAQGATGAVNAFSDLHPAVQGSALGLLALGTAGAGLVATIGTVVPRIQQGRESLREMGKAGQFADRQLGRVGKGLAISSGVLAGLATAGVLMEKLQDASVQATPSLEKVKAGLIEIGSSSQDLQLSGDAAKYLGESVKLIADPSVAQGAEQTVTSIASLGMMDATGLREAREQVGAMDEALANMVRSGSGEQAKRAFEQLSAAAVRGGASVDQVKKALPQYADALAGVANESKVASEATDEAGRSTSSFTGEAKSATGALQEYSSAAEALKARIDALNDTNLTAAEADIRHRDALAAVTASIKDNGRTLDLNTAKGRSNHEAVIASIRAASAHAQAVANQTGSVDRGNKVFGTHISQLRRVLAQSGMTKAQIDQLIRTYGRVPKSATTKVDAPGADAAKRKADMVRSGMKSIPALVSTQIVASAGGFFATAQQVRREISSIDGRVVSVSFGGSGSLGRTARAEGGPVEPGPTYLVGERGPELLRFDRPGVIEPNSQYRAAMASRALQPVAVDDYQSAMQGRSMRGTGGPTVVNQYSIRIDGALDPKAVAVQVERVLTNLKRSRGGTALAFQ